MKKIIKDRKTLYIVLSLVMVCVFALTVVYAALNAVLEINGNAEVSAAEWDIRLENPIVTSGSVNNNLPVISGNKEASFSATLNNPGDFYEFSIDVVNNGSIDAMIDSVTKTPTLSVEQSKYLNYIIEYQNGESINIKQLVQANSFVILKVKVEFRKDLVASDLPSGQNILDLSFKVNYVQSDDSNDNVLIENNGTYNPYSIGNEKCFGNECFYIISSDDTTVTMLAKYNLFVGNKVISVDPETDESEKVPLESPTGIQDERAKGNFYDKNSVAIDVPWYGTVAFASNEYWIDYDISGSSYVYNEKTLLYPYIENYRNYLQQYVDLTDIRLISYQELIDFGWPEGGGKCKTCYEWLYSTTYWTGTASQSGYIYSVNRDGNLKKRMSVVSGSAGIRPVIVISKDYFHRDLGLFFCW